MFTEEGTIYNFLSKCVNIIFQLFMAKSIIFRSLWNHCKVPDRIFKSWNVIFPSLWCLRSVKFEKEIFMPKASFSVLYTSTRDHLFKSLKWNFYVKKYHFQFFMKPIKSFRSIVSKFEISFCNRMLSFRCTKHYIFLSFLISNFIALESEF